MRWKDKGHEYDKYAEVICDDSIKYVMVDDYEKLLDIANEA